jgi:NTP pyrophosphatase (non-canonical NTP hydrolase)
MLITKHYTLRAANVARNSEWPGASRIDASFRGNELAGEVGEACNIIKKLERERLDIPGSWASSDRLADELADIIICVDLIGMHYGIDLRSAVFRKFNQTSAKMDFDTFISEEFSL